MQIKIKSIEYKLIKDATLGEVVSKLEELHDMCGCKFSLDGTVRVVF